MPNIPGAVTDPSRVRGEDVELKSGSDTIRGYLARPSQPGRGAGQLASQVLAGDVGRGANDFVVLPGGVQTGHEHDDEPLHT